MVGAILLIFNDPIDRLLPATAPALAPGPTTTWDAQVVAPDGSLDWAAAISAGRSAVPGSPTDAWPRVQAALTAAGLPLAVPEQTLAMLRAGKRPESDPQAVQAQRAAAPAVFAALAEAGPDALFAVVDPPGTTVGSTPALEAVRQLIRAAVPQDDASTADQLSAARRLASLMPVAAGIEDLAGAALAHRAEASLWRRLIAVLAAHPGDPALVEQVVAIRGSLRLPAMPAALRRARLDALRACTEMHAEMMVKGRSELRVNHPPDINHALGLLNRWFDQLAVVLPGDLADGRQLAVLAGRPQPIPDLDTSELSDDRTLAARMLFDRAVSERSRQTAAVLATLQELDASMDVSEILRSARRAALMRAAVHALLATPAQASAEDLNRALPPLPAGGSIVFRADGPNISIDLGTGRELETLATIPRGAP